MARISEEKVWTKWFKEAAFTTPLPQCTAYQYLQYKNQDNLDGIAVRYFGTDITYSQLFQRIEDTASAFAALGVKEGDKVSFLSVSIPESIAAVYALNKLGATANTVDPRMDVTTITHMVEGSGSDVLVCIDMAWPKVERVLRRCPQAHVIVQSPADSLPFIKRIAMKIMDRTRIEWGKDVMKWSDFMARGKGVEAPEAPYVGDRVAAITYTGGTTNTPKGVMLTNDGMNAVAFNFEHAGLYIHRGDRFLGIIPMFTAYGMVCGLHMPLCLSFQHIPVPKFVPTEIGKLVRDHKPNHMISTPAFYELLIESKEVEGMDLSFLITMGSGGDSMNEGLEERLNAFMKEHNIRYPLAQGYGLSEVCAPATFCVNDIYKRGSVGIPSVLTNVSIFDPETGEELGYNQKGEVCITGPTMMKGYSNRPDATAEIMRLHDDGQVWIHSGDIGHMDEDGFLYIDGRIKRMITRFDGHKIFPVYLEGVIAERDSVRNCCVVGVRDMEHNQGHYPLILVEFVDGVHKDAACKAMFRECKERLEERGRPVAVLAVDEVPLTGMGKNDYRALEDQYGEFDYLTWQRKL